MYISYSGNLKNDIAKLQFPNDKQRDDEEKKFNNHYNFIKKLTPKDLLLIDNFNPGSNDDELFFEILSLQCNILFTTTMKFKDVHLMEVKRIESNDILFSWFNEKYIKNLAQKRIIQNIINALEGHTFAIKIVSSLINDCCIEPSYILQKLSERNLLVDISDELEFGKDNLHKEATYTQHINALFSIFTLTTEQVTMMLQFCLFPSSGISGSILKNLLNHKNMNIVNQLKKMGLIQKDSNGTFFIHSLTLEYILSKYKPSIENYYTLLESIQKICRQSYDYVPNYYLLFGIVENCIRFAKKDNIVFYTKFLLDISWAVDNHTYRPLAEMISSEIRALDIEIYSNHTKARIYYYLGTHVKDIISSESFLSLALEFAETEFPKGKSQLVSDIYNALANIYFTQENYEQAQISYKKALDSSPMDSFESILALLCNYGLVTAKLRYCNDSIKILNDFSKKMVTLGYQFSHLYSQITQIIGLLYLYDDQIDAGESFLYKSLIIYALLTNCDINLLKVKADETIRFYTEFAPEKLSSHAYVKNFLTEAILRITKEYPNLNKQYTEYLKAKKALSQ